MIGLDTNIVIRYLIQDDPEQSRKVNQCIEKWIKNKQVLWICQITLCEIFWVLEKCYKLGKEELVSILYSLLKTRQIRVEKDDIAWQALYDYEKSARINFPDCLIGRQNMHLECIHTYTFDKVAAKELPKSFLLLS